MKGTGERNFIITSITRVMGRLTGLVALILLAFVSVTATERRPSVVVTILHFSDYHSHALPFYSEGRPSQGGIARAIAYMRRHKSAGALVFNGGDMLNHGAPAWSDKFRCVEWEWLNGIVDAMAFGNHDADYGADAFARCSDRVKYPILGANVEGFPAYTVLQSHGMRIGVFAVAGPDFPALVRVPELKFSDATQAARKTVQQLREVEHVNAVVLIGHEHLADDFALARNVPGIDVIFGTHSHLKRDLMRIPDTRTWYISPFQYLTYISHVELVFEDGKLQDVKGGLKRVDSSMPEDETIAQNVARLQNELVADKEYHQLFVPFAKLSAPMEIDQFAKQAVGLMKEATGADCAISTSSSFRQSLPAGPIDEEALRAALPYDNEIVLVDLPSWRYEKLMQIATAKKGSEDELVCGGLVADGRATVKLATIDYLARVSPEYHDIFAGVPIRNTGKRVRELFHAWLARAP